EAAALGHGFAAYGEQELFRLQRLCLSVLVFERNRHTFGVLLHAVYGAAGKDLYVLLAEAFVELRGDFVVFNGHDSRQRFKDGARRAKGVVDRCDLPSTGACTDYDQRLWNLRQLQDRTIRQDGLVVGLDPRERLRFRAAHEQNVRRFEARFLAVFLDTDLPGTLIAAPALHPLHFVFLKEKLDALGVFLYDLVFSGQRGGPVQLHTADLNAIFRGFLAVIVNLRVVQQHLGRNAADVQTGAPKKGILLDDDGLQAEFTRAYRSDVSAWAAADNCHVILCHSLSP